MKKSFSTSTTKSMPYVYKERFYNYPQEKSFSVALPSLYMYVRSLFSRIMRPRVDAKNWIQRQTPLEQSIEPVITWIGHATVLVQIGGLNILIDPLFGKPSFLFPRIVPPGINLHELPPLDMVLLSHNHHDHMHEPSLREIERLYGPHMLVPEKVGSWFYTRKFSKVRELTWWDAVRMAAQDGVGGMVEITFLPAQHWSQRGLFDRNKTLWGSWMISYKEYKVYFAGDTAYGAHFAEIGKEFKNITIALLPIAPGEPHKLLHHSHMNASQAVQAFCDLNAQKFIPMHWGTFHFGIEAFYKPIEHLAQAWHEKKELALKALCIAKVGQQIKLLAPSPIAFDGVHDTVQEKQL